ncbi:hypothetical protein AC578_91 [Pseudocercospora eumusae]|uniref:Uncharacterized protein n=1 Tax=Pseudocercospora eumusae TaxID=321146 RepID=A0A139HP70_9PEZI|nr:hypothetical protein AC578_91 [Pseudocercospora eumusae]
MPNDTPNNINSWERLERGECSLCRLRSLPRDPNRPCACNRLPDETESDFYMRIGTPLPNRAPRADNTPARRRRNRGQPEPEGSDPFVASSPLQGRGTIPFSIPPLAPPSPQTSRNPTLTPPNDPENIIVLHSPRNTPEPAAPWPSPASTHILPDTPLPSLARTPQPTTHTPSDSETHINSLNLHQLRHSRRQAATDLEHSTAHVHRLWQQGQVLEALKLANQALLKQAECEVLEARLEEAERNSNRSIGMRNATAAPLWIIVFMLLLLVVLMFDSPDRIYAREVQRRFWEGD